MTLSLIALGTGVCADLFSGSAPRRAPAFVVRAEGQTLLLDAGEGARHGLHEHGIDLADVTDVFLSHTHPDHAALPQLIQSAYCRHAFGSPHSRSSELRIYMPAAVVPKFPAVWDFHQPEHGGRYWDGFAPTFVPLEDQKPALAVGSLTVVPFEVYHGHGKHPACGFRIETPSGVVAYTGDSGYCDALVPLARGAELLIADCSVPVGAEYEGGYGHMGPLQCGRVALAAGVRELWLTHYFGVNTESEMIDEVRRAGYVGSVRVAHDGEPFSLP